MLKRENGWDLHGNDDIWGTRKEHDELKYVLHHINYMATNVKR